MKLFLLLRSVLSEFVINIFIRREAYEAFFQRLLHRSVYEKILRFYFFNLYRFCFGGV